ncbi:hypothetical protein D4T53_02085 [Enterococcus faecium]|nr:hypothetical protein [Enterococcus faecium]
MANNKKKRYIGLIGLYVLLVIASSLIQQIKYYGLIAWILIVITILLVIVLWTYLLRKNIVNVTWKSMTYDSQSHRSERIFLCSLVTLVSPILRFHDITSYDVILSVIALLVAVIGFTLNERHLSKKNDFR